jgi:hypothetical protein
MAHPTQMQLQIHHRLVLSIVVPTAPPTRDISLRAPRERAVRPPSLEPLRRDSDE